MNDEFQGVIVYRYLEGITIIVEIHALGIKRIVDESELNWGDRDSEEDIEYISLGDITEQLKQMYPDQELFITAICESGLNGTIYQYGNYGPYWVEHGTTRGYA